MSDEQFWIRSLKHHTYWNIVRDVGTFYAVDNEQDAETIAALGLGKRESPPPRAVRPEADRPTVQILPETESVTATDFPLVMSTESTGGALTPDDRIDIPRMRRRRANPPPATPED